MITVSASSPPAMSDHPAPPPPAMSDPRLGSRRCTCAWAARRRAPRAPGRRRVPKTWPTPWPRPRGTRGEGGSFWGGEGGGGGEGRGWIAIVWSLEHASFSPSLSLSLGCCLLFLLLFSLFLFVFLFLLLFLLLLLYLSLSLSSFLPFFLSFFLSFFLQPTNMNNSDNPGDSKTKGLNLVCSKANQEIQQLLQGFLLRHGPSCAGDGLGRFS